MALERLEEFLASLQSNVGHNFLSRNGRAGQCMVRKREARQVEEWIGSARPGWAWTGKATQGNLRDDSRQGTDWLGQSRMGMAGTGKTGLGEARKGTEGLCAAGRGTARKGKARTGIAMHSGSRIGLDG